MDENPEPLDRSALQRLDDQLCEVLSHDAALLKLEEEGELPWGIRI